MAAPSSRRLVYDDLHLQVVAAVPALGERARAELDWWGAEEAPRHVFFAEVLNAYLSERLQKQDEPSVALVAAFLERMAVADDVEIGNVLRDTVLESVQERDKPHWPLFEASLGPAALRDWRRLLER